MRRDTKRDRMEKKEEVRKVEEDYGSAWPGHHTPLLMDRWVGSTTRSHPLLPSVVRTLPLHLPLVARQSAGSHKWATATRFRLSPFLFHYHQHQHQHHHPQVAYVPPAWRSPSLGNRLVAGVRASPSRARSSFLYLVCKYLIFFAND